MAKIELLNNITHRDLRVNQNYSAVLGHNITSAMVFVTEFLEVQKEFPILFHKDANSEELQATALLGIQKDENLFLSEEDASRQKYLGWDANYVPAILARGPFSIGIQTQLIDGTEKPAPVIHIDMDHPAVEFGGNAQLFLENGGGSEYLNGISNTLNLIRDGMHLTKVMLSVFDQYQLLEDVIIDIQLDNGDKFKISGFKTIHADRLSELKGEALERLSRAGFLQAAYFVVASLSNIKKLIEIKNRRLGAR